MTYETIKPLKVSDSIVSQIENLILEGVLKPGDKLPSERDLALELDVSRSSLRDALVRMEAKSLLQVKPGGGTFVNDILGPTITDPLVHLLKEQPQALLDILELRNALEEFAAYFAAERSTNADRQALKQLLANLETAKTEQDAFNTSEAITAFQLAVANASHNVALIHVTRGLHNLLHTTIRKSLEKIYTQPGAYNFIHQHRTEIYEAIEKKDPDAAKNSAHSLILFVNKTLREADATTPTESPSDQTDEIFTLLDQESFKPTKLSDFVVERLERLIFSGTLKPGDQLPAESELTKKLGVSKAVLRDAMIKLEAKGLLNIKRGGGIFVCDIPGPTLADPLVHLLKNHPEATYDFLEFRRSLEEFATGCAADRCTAADHEALKQSIAKLESTLETGDSTLIAEQDAEFHLAVAEASHNTALVYVIRGLFNLLRSNIRRNIERLTVMSEEHEILHNHHRDIYEAILSGDTERACRTAHVHVTFIDQSLRELDLEEERKRRSLRRIR